MRCNAAEAFLERGVEPRLCQAQLAAEPGVQPGFQRGQPLFHLGVEAGEVELVQLSQISPISRVHGIEPIHELICDILPQLFVERKGELGCNRHRRRLVKGPPRQYNLRSAGA